MPSPPYYLLDFLPTGRKTISRTHATTQPQKRERGNTTAIETIFLHFFTVVALTAHQKRNSPSNSGYLHSTHPAFQYATTPGATLAQQSGKPYFKEK